MFRRSAVIAGLLALLAAAPVAAQAPLCVPIEALIADMGENEARARGVNPDYGWSRRAQANTAVATWDRQPDWWRADNPLYDGAWGRILPWFVVFEGADGPSAPATVQIGRMSLRWLSARDGVWRLLDSDAPWEGSLCDPGGNYVGCPMVTPVPGPDGMPAFATGGPAGNVHGWFRFRDLPDPHDVKSLTVAIELRVVQSAPGAVVLAHVGADFYPDDGGVQGTNPGAGLSRMRRLGPDWTAVSMTVLSDLTGNDTGVLAEDLRRSPPC